MPRYKRKSESSSQFAEMFADLVPEVSIKTITLRGGSGYTPLKVKLVMHLIDVIEDDLLSGWLTEAGGGESDVTPFEDFIKINVIQVCDEGLDAVFNKQVTFQQHYEANETDWKGSQQYYNKRAISLRDKIPHPHSMQSSRTSHLAKYQKKDSLGRTVLELPVEETFTILPHNADPRGVKYLAYYIWAALDVEAMAASLGADKRYFENAAAKISKRPKKELVIKEYNTVTHTNIFQLPSGDTWKGPVHRMGSADSIDEGWMTGTSHAPNSQNLTVTEIQNQKIRDFRLVNRVGQNYVSVINQRRAAAIGRDIRLTTPTPPEETAIFDTVRNYTKNLAEREIVPDTNSAKFTPLWTSTDELHHGNMLFGFNWLEFLKENSMYPHLWTVSKKTTNELLRIAKIHSFKIVRNQVDTTARDSNRLGTPHLPRKKVFDGTTMRLSYENYRRVLAKTSESSETGVLQTVNNDVCFLKETKVAISAPENVNDFQVRWFTLTDRNLVTERNGDYQYSIEVRAMDPTQIFMNRQMIKLRRSKYRLLFYLKRAESYIKNKPCFDIYQDRFSNEFVRWASPPGVAKNRWLWQQSANDYLNVLEDVSGILSQPAYAGASYSLRQALSAALSSYVDPLKGTPEGILTALGLIDSLSDALNKMSGGQLATTTKFGAKGWVGLGNRTTTGFEKKKPSSRARWKILEIDHVFGVELGVGGSRGMGYDYLTNQTNDFVDESIKGAGLRTLSARYFRKRCNIETQRFFQVSNRDFSWNEIKSSVPDLTLSYVPVGDSLDSSKFSYLSPSFVFSSPGSALPSVGGHTGGSLPPVASTGTGAGQVGGASVNTFATSYAMSNVGTGLSISKAIATSTLRPMNLLNYSSNALKTPSAPAPKSLDDLVADMAAAQNNPDFNLYAISIDAYKDPSIQRGSKLSTPEQQLKAKYAGILAAKNCVMVEEKKEFDEPRFHTFKHPSGFDVQSINYGKELFPFIPEIFLEKIIYLTNIKAIGAPVWKSATPMMPKALININPLPVFTTLVQAGTGFKSGGPQGPIAYGSMHVSNFQLLDFTDTSTPNIVSNVNPSYKTSVLKSLPNQLKSLALSKTSFVLDDLYTTDSSPSEKPMPPLYNSQNMAKLYQLFHNIVTIEYLDSFTVGLEESGDSGRLEKVSSGEMLLKAPRWKTLSQGKISDLEAGSNAVALLCKLTRYKNRELGIGYEKLHLPVIDEYFLMLVDPSRTLALEIPTQDDSTYIDPSDGHEGEFANDADTDLLEGFPDLSKYRMLEVDGEELLVKEFDGSVRVCD